MRCMMRVGRKRVADRGSRASTTLCDPSVRLPRHNCCCMGGRSRRPCPGMRIRVRPRTSRPIDVRAGRSSGRGRTWSRSLDKLDEVVTAGYLPRVVGNGDDEVEDYIISEKVEEVISVHETTEA